MSSAKAVDSTNSADSGDSVDSGDSANAVNGASTVNTANPVSSASAANAAANTANTTEPNPPRLRRCAVPKHEPRSASRVFHYERPSPTLHTQGTLALTLPIEAEVADVRVQEQSVVQAATERDPGRASLLPEPKAWAATFIQAAMEVAGGVRSAGQLVRWTTPEVHAILVRRGALTARARRGMVTSSKPRIRALIICAPRAGVCEASAVIAEPERVRAVAFRMEGIHGRWRVTELEIG